VGPLVAPDTLGHWLGLTTIDEDRAELLLEVASDLVRGHLAQEVDYHAEDSVDVIGNGGRVLLCPELPVWQVHSIGQRFAGDSAFEDLIELADYDVELGYDHRLGILRRAGGARWTKGATYRIVTTHGYGVEGDSGVSVDPLPGSIKAVVLRCAARGYTNPTGLRTESIGRYNRGIGFGGGDAAGLTLSAGDKSDLEAFLPGRRSGAR